jgi:sugar phosphate isomerase/epimerase
MQIGAMNHPAADLCSQIHQMAALGFDFVDLTLEPPAAASWNIDVKQVARVIGDTGLGVVGHTAYYLPVGSPFENLRRAAVAELQRCMGIFSELGAAWMNVHPHYEVPFHDRAFVTGRNVQSLAELLEASRQLGVGVMVENLPTEFRTATQIAELLGPLPDLGLHLDVGHTNLMADGNTTESILQAHGSRLRHVHLHDNKGGTADLHLPLGTGTLDTAQCVSALKAIGYNGTITLEVFSPDTHYLTYSRDVLRRLWDEPSTGE